MIARPPAHRVRTDCRACGGRALSRVLALGNQPLANANLRDLSEAAAEARYPLDLWFCDSCSLVQLADVIDPEILFRDYIYVTGTSETMRAHNRDHARDVAALLRLDRTDLVVEIASNDGSLLACYRELGMRTLGVEPAANIASLARNRGIETIDVFFDSRVGERLRAERGPARVVLGNNVLAHVDDPRDFLAGARAMLADDGLVIVEVPYARTMLDGLEYDTVYHEHLCYFSGASLRRLCEAAGLTIVRVDQVPVHGGSLRVFAGLPAHYGASAPAVDQLIEEEERIGIASAARWKRFAHDVAAQRSELRALLAGLVAEGRTIAAYGAPAKGNTLLNYCQIGVDTIPYTVDRSEFKVGTFTPGMHLPVLPVPALLERQPDFVLILAWNFAEEVMRQQSEYARRGGRFIIPVPRPRIVE